MSLIPYILGLIGSVSISAIVVLFNQLTDIQIHSLSIFLIVPLGGILLGIGGVGGFILGKKLTQTKMLKIDYVISVFLGLFTFFSINYISYINTYISIDDKGTKILNQYTKPDNYVSISELITFGEYVDMINSSSSHQFRIKGIKIGGEVEAGETTTTIFFYVEIIGVLIGSLGMSFFLIGDKYCDKCKKYYVNKEIKSFDLEKYETYVDNINKTKEDGVLLKNTISEIENRVSKTKKYGKIVILYCPICFDGYLQIKFFALDTEGEFNEVPDTQQTLVLTQEVVKELV